MKIGAPVLVLLFIISVSYAAVPAYTGFVNDFASVLNSTQQASLSTLLTALERNTTAEVAVVTVESATDPFSYALEIFNTWKIGKDSNDNGLLILYAKEQNRIQVMTGYGLEGILPDSKVGRLLDEYYVPLRDAGQVADAITAVTEQFAVVIYENADEVRAGRASAKLDILEFLPVIIMFSFIIIAIIAGIIQHTPKCPVHKVKMKKISSEYVGQTFGRIEIITYACPVCNRKIKKRRDSGGFFFLMGGGGHGGGFGGGGFGGGGTGGGGAGR